MPRLARGYARPLPATFRYLAEYGCTGRAFHAKDDRGTPSGRGSDARRACATRARCNRRCVQRGLLPAPRRPLRCIVRVCLRVRGHALRTRPQPAPWPRGRRGDARPVRSSPMADGRTTIQTGSARTLLAWKQVTARHGATALATRGQSARKTRQNRQSRWARVGRVGDWRSLGGCRSRPRPHVPTSARALQVHGPTPSRREADSERRSRALWIRSASLNLRLSPLRILKGKR